MLRPILASTTRCKPTSRDGADRITIPTKALLMFIKLGGCLNISCRSSDGGGDGAEDEAEDEEACNESFPLSIIMALEVAGRSRTTLGSQRQADSCGRHSSALYLRSSSVQS